MKLIKVTKNKSKHFRLKDGRIGVIYESGYIRVNTKSKYNNSNRYYQLNQKVKIWFQEERFSFQNKIWFQKEGFCSKKKDFV